MPPESRPFPAAAVAALSNGHKIEAIKIVRQEWGTDLKDSIQEAGANSQRSGLTWLFVLALVGALIYYFLRAR
jgi:hypothetical protein